MCGRFVSTAKPERIASYFGAEADVETLGENYNVAPTQDIYGVVTGPDGDPPRAGLPLGTDPGWAKDRKIGAKMINARSETLADKPAFKGVFAKKRCLIPMDGFYEWKAGAADGPVHAKGKPVKQPMFIHRLDGEPLAVAGLWTAWRDKEAGRVAGCRAARRHDGCQRDDGADPRPHAGHRPGLAVGGVARPGQPRHRSAVRTASPNANEASSRCTRCRPTSTTCATRTGR